MQWALVAQPARRSIESPVLLPLRIRTWRRQSQTSPIAFPISARLSIAREPHRRRCRHRCHCQRACATTLVSSAGTACVTMAVSTAHMGLTAATAALAISRPSRLHHRQLRRPHPQCHHHRHAATTPVDVSRLAKAPTLASPLHAPYTAHSHARHRVSSSCCRWHGWRL